MNIKERNSSFELLRLILMFMIIVHHSIVHGLGMGSLGLPSSLPLVINHNGMLTASIAEAFTVCAVNCFVLISGYFGIKLSLNKVLKLLLSITFYTLLFTTSYYIILGQYKSAIGSLLIFAKSNYWFIIDYFWLMAFAPLLNLMFEKMNKRYIGVLICVMLFINCYLGFVWNGSMSNRGYSLIQFIMLYCIARYIRINNITFKRNLSLITYILTSLLIGLILYGCWISGNITWAWKMTNYNNPLLIITSIALIMFCSKINIRSKFINVCAASSLAIYMVQSSVASTSIYYNFLNTNNLKIGGVIIIIIISAIAYIVFSIIIDQIQKVLSSFIISRIENNMNRHNTALNS